MGGLERWLKEVWEAVTPFVSFAGPSPIAASVFAIRAAADTPSTSATFNSTAMFGL